MTDFSERTDIKMLKNISPIISPELLKILMEMGHSDEIVIGDGNFPAASIAQRSRSKSLQRGARS